MLTVKAPIEITARTEYVADAEAFYHRIRGNYSLMEAHVDAEDLLHVSATPPEIYVQEGTAMTSLIQSEVRNENNLQKVEILNNLMNRIVVSADAHLTYQDRVFITDTLYKLGIRDERRFMNAFYRMAEETHNTNTLIDLYMSNGERLKEAIETIEERQRTQVRTEEVREGETGENYLYQSIMNRLMTGAVYQIVSNFNRTTEANSIEQREYVLSNQSYVAQHVLLSMLRDNAGVSGQNLTYLNTNIYEEDLEQSATDVTHVRNEITAAVLMDMLQNVYHAGYDRFVNNSETYYRFEDVFYGSSVQTLQRLVRMTGSTEVTNATNVQYLTEANQLSAQEITLLESFSDNTELVEMLNSYSENPETYIENRISERVRPGENAYAPAETIVPENPEEPEESGTEGEESGDLTHLTQTDQVSEEDIRRLQETVNALNVQNEQRRQVFMETLEKVRSRVARDNGPTGMERTRRDGVLALTSPEELREKLIEQEAAVDRRDREILMELAMALPGESATIYQMLNQYQMGDQEVINKNYVRPASQGELMYDIRQAEIEAAAAASERAAKAVEQAEMLNATIERAGRGEGRQAQKRPKDYKAIPTVHRSTETISEEEIAEQLQILRQDMSRQIRHEVSQESVIESRSSRTTQVVNQVSEQQTLNERQIRQMIDAGIKDQVSTISNQVFRKLETQMRNEKIRRGY